MHIVRRVTFETTADGVSVLALADHEDARGRTLTFRRGDGDGAATLTTESGASVVGGVRAEIDGWRLRLGLTPEAAAALGLPEETELFLELARQEAVELRDGLAAVGL
jgi:hypothetical protein